MRDVWLGIAVVVFLGSCHNGRVQVAPVSVAGSTPVLSVALNQNADAILKEEVRKTLQAVTGKYFWIEVSGGIVTIHGADPDQFEQLARAVIQVPGVSHVLFNQYRSPVFAHFERWILVHPLLLRLRVENRLPIWPPALPSSTWEIPRELVVNGATATLSDAMRVLAKALADAKYPTSATFEIPGGIVLMTPIEQIDVDGTPLGPSDRWSLSVSPLRQPTLSGYLVSLLGGRKGLYRTIMIVITSESIAPQGPAEMEDLLKLQRSGQVSHPNRSRTISSSHRIWALVYEFSKLDVDADPAQVVPGRLTAQEHLTAAGILRSLEGLRASR